MYWQGILIGLLSFLIIGLFHPLVIKTEYYWGKKSWYLYFFSGIVFIILSLCISNVFGSAVAALVGFACFWTIKETFEQEQRVQKGWFPANPGRKGAVIVRSETPADYDSIRRINEQAFGQPDEAFLVEKLRKNPAFNPALSLVAVKNNIVVGHILFFPAKIISDTGKETETLALAPMSVFPAFQRQGIGSSLVSEGLAVAARQSYYGSVVVLGHEHFYPRFGFVKASGYGVRSPYDCPDETFMIQELKAGALSGVQGMVEYPAVFKIFES